MPKAIKKKIPKKTTDTESDVKDRLSTLMETLKQRQKSVLLYGAIVLTVIIAVSGFLFYNHYSRKKAETLAYEAYKSYYNLYQKQPVARVDQYTRSLDLFKQSYDIRKSPVVLMYIADCYYELGRYDEALKMLKDFIHRYSAEETLIPIAYEKMSMIYEKEGDTEEAIKSLETLYNLKGYIYKDFALIEYAKLLEKEGKTEEAKKKYKELTEKFPNSPFKAEAEAKLSEKK